jgi:FkbM family methyltransferase
MIARTIARSLGYDLVPRRKLKDLHAQLVATLERQAVDAVVDVGANVGQYASRLREAGWQGPILSLEPIPAAHKALVEAARGDARWEVLPPMAAGAEAGTVALEVSAESDMSSTLGQSALLQRISPSSAVTQRIDVRQARLDALPELRTPHRRRLFVKIDVQGAEPRVLAGMAGIWDRVVGLQLELALLPLYEGERPWLEIVQDLATQGFEPYLMFPGYFARALGRQVQVDIVFYRKDEAAPAAAGTAA